VTGARSTVLPERLATIDLGTNTVRLLVIETEQRGWRSLYAAQRVTRLGEGQSAAGRLLEGPMLRTVDTVAEFVAEAERWGAREVHVVATSAVRQAPNREAFVGRVRQASGRDVEVLSGEDEARLTLLGVATGLPHLHGSFILFDIGGGSTEVVLAQQRAPVKVVSLALGVVPLTERHIGQGPVTRDQLFRLRRDAEPVIRAGVPSEMLAASTSTLVGTAGTVTTLAALDLGLTRYEAERVQGHVLSRAAVERMLEWLSAMTLTERAAVPCLEVGRADVLIAGIVVCVALMERLGHSSLMVSDRGLREGIVERIVSAKSRQ
jgi:exopolyphosphatase / guanosine-5'-triphosphate,3'-diphosphate pyrophosphatase